MADLVINAAAVAASNLATVRREYPSGASVIAGQIVYRNASGRWVLFDSDAGSGAGANVTDEAGVALHNSENGQPLAVAVADDNFNWGNTFPANTVLYGSKNAGNVTQDVPAAANYPRPMGLPRSTTRCVLRPMSGGIAV